MIHRSPTRRSNRGYVYDNVSTYASGVKNVAHKRIYVGIPQNSRRRRTSPAEGSQAPVHHGFRPTRSPQTGCSPDGATSFTEQRYKIYSRDEKEQSQMLAGFSRITLRELITDSVIELIKSKAHISTKAVPRHTKAHRRDNKHSISSSSEDGTRPLHNDEHGPCSSGNRKLNCTNSFPSTSRSLPLTQVVRKPRVFNQNLSHTSEFNEAVQRSAPNPTRSSDPGKIYSKNQSCDQYVNLSALQDRRSPHTSHGRKSKVADPDYRESRLQDPTPDPDEVAAKKSNPYTQTSAVGLSVRSSLRSSKAYVVSPSLKKLRFEQQQTQSPSSSARNQ